MKKILVCGLPGAGKTYLSTRLAKRIGAIHLNADDIRKKFDDWDFSVQGRQRQADRMKALAEEYVYYGRYAVADFVCPTKKLRERFQPDIVIWIDTIQEGRFEDTNKMFQKLTQYDYHVTTKLSDDEINKIGDEIKDD